MMTLETWLAFSMAAGIVLIIPGPTILSVISHSVAYGRNALIPLVIGVTLGDLAAMSLSLLGLGAILASSAALFSILKILGAVYLIYLGVRLWRSQPEAEACSTGISASSGSLIRDLFLTTTLNPKSIAFFIAFLPQFVDPATEVPLQLLALGGTFLVLGALNTGLYALFAGQLREKVQNPTACRWLNRCGGTTLMGAGLLTATVHHSA
jgi:threonine/homoserine/homoserine lactone efflux protein